jgi:predicted nucleic acid-binding protein
VGDVPTIVVTDANLLINLIHAGRILLLGELRGYRFVVPEEVVAEVTVEAQLAELQSAIGANAVSVCPLAGMDGLALFAELRVVMGAGESACLALAELNGWSVASDERRRFRREAIARLGVHRLLTTPDIFLLAIRSGLLSVAEADEDKALLASRRFVMKFGSFSELL